MTPTGNMVELTTRANEAQAGIVRAVLADAGIESYLAVGGGVMANAEFGLSYVPTSIYVSRADLERAHEVLERNREDSVDIDWSEVDTGDDSPLTDREIEAHLREKDQKKDRTGFYAIIGVGLALAVFAFFAIF